MPVAEKWPVVPFASLALHELLPTAPRRSPARTHLEAAIAWLCRAQDMGGEGGISYGYSLVGGWRPCYREVSGYIAPTLFDVAERLGQPKLRERALSVCHWLLRVQDAAGSYSNPRYGEGRGLVFDTGQVLFGLLRGYKETGDEALLRAAERAGDWLVAISDEKGLWTRNTFRDIPHTYNTRGAWGLLELERLSPHPRRREVAQANLEWALTQQHEGWFRQCAFERGQPPFTHTVAYAIRGLWESSQLLGEPSWREGALRAAEAMLRHVHEDGFIPGRIDERGHPRSRSCCLTGNAQLAIVWARMHGATGEARFREGAVRALRYVMAAQDVGTEDANRYGGIQGSLPLWGSYAPFTYPSWAAKFFIDALLLCGEWL